MKSASKVFYILSIISASILTIIFIVFAIISPNILKAVLESNGESLSSQEFAAASKLLIISFVFCIIISICALIVSAIALHKLNTAKSRSEITVIAIISLFLCSIIPGTLALLTKDKDYENETSL